MNLDVKFSKARDVLKEILIKADVFDWSMDKSLIKRINEVLLDGDDDVVPREDAERMAGALENITHLADPCIPEASIVHARFIAEEAYNTYRHKYPKPS